MTKTILGLAIAALLLAANAQAAPLLLRPRAVTEVTLGTQHPHRIFVSAPEGPAPAGGFPVIYILDGEAWFGAAIEIAKMREYEKLDPAIIVGVGYPSHSFFDAAGRSYDFSPPGSSDPDMDGFALGGADEFLSFLTGTLKPWVRAHYKSDPGRQILFGHSLGGLFVLHALFKSPESFNVYLAASPDIPFANRNILKEEPAFEANPARKKIRLLVTVGSLESHPSAALMDDYRRYFTAHPKAHAGQTVAQTIDAMFADQRGYDKASDTRHLTDRLAKSGVKASFVMFDGEEHMSAAISALNRGIPFALRP